MIFALFPIIIIVALVITSYEDRKRSKMLAAMTPDDRERFLNAERYEKERLHKKAQEAEIPRDEKASMLARQAINVAKAEGRSYARSWIPSKDVERLNRWAGRNGYSALRVKTGKSGDVQMSFSGWK